MTGYISSVWKQDGRYTVAIGSLVQRVPVSEITAENMINDAKKLYAIRKHLPVRGGGYVWFFDKTLDLDGFLAPDELNEVRKQARNGTRRNIDSTRGGQRDGHAHFNH